MLRVIASDGSDWNMPPPIWEHVSVSAKDFHGERTPTWYHPPEASYVNDHEHVLHLWRPVGVDLVMPPTECV